MLELMILTPSNLHTRTLMTFEPEWADTWCALRTAPTHTPPPPTWRSICAHLPKPLPPLFPGPFSLNDDYLLSCPEWPAVVGCGWTGDSLSSCQLQRWLPPKPPQHPTAPSPPPSALSIFLSSSFRPRPDRLAPETVAIAKASMLVPGLACWETRCSFDFSIIRCLGWESRNPVEIMLAVPSQGQAVCDRGTAFPR